MNGTIGTIPFVVCVIAAFLIGAVIAFFLGIEYRKKAAEAALGSAEEEAKRMLSDAIKAAETKKKEAIIEENVKAGMPLGEARAKVHYHTLQTREEQ